MLLLCDFNSDLNFKVNSREDTYLGRKLMRVLNFFNMRNVINQATRTTQTSSTIIDLIITTDTSKIRRSGSFNSGISDHHIVFAVLNYSGRDQSQKSLISRTTKG